MAISLAQSPVESNLASFSLPTATTAGNCLVVCVASFASGTTVTGITLGGSADNFSQAADGNDGVAEGAIWVDYDCAGGQTAIVVSGTLAVDAGNGRIVAYEIAGLDATSGVVDKVSSSSGSGAAWTSLATATTTVADEIWIGCVDGGTSVTPPGSPWTNNGSGTFGCAGYQIVASTGSATYAGSQASGHWGAAVVTLKAGAGATSGPNYGGSASDLGGGSGSWADPSNAAGTGTGTYATWAVP